MREAIETMETVLYATEPPAAEGRAAVARSLEEIRRQLGRASLSAGQKLRAQSIDNWALASIPRTAWESYDVATARGEWERYRDVSFVPADWFRRTPFVPTAAPPAYASPTRDEPLRHAQAMNALKVALDRARTAVTPWPDDPFAVDHERLAEARAELQRETEWIRRYFPRRGEPAGEAWIAAHDQLQRATFLVADLLRPTQISSKIPARADLETRLRAIDEAMAAAERALTAAQAGSGS
jgi:hypothetical protein